VSEWLKESRILRDVPIINMSKYCVYVLQSLKDGNYYIGYSKNFEERLIAHNNGSVKSTKLRRPLQLIHIENYGTIAEARKREKKIKSYKGGEAFKQLIGIV
jgi:putative endonuclease